jgi:hypothetical protein
MVRWIAFDDETAEALVCRFKRGAAEIRQGHPVDAALHHGKPSLLVLPSSTAGTVLLARFDPTSFDPTRLRPNSAHASNASPARESVAYKRTGSFGPIDQPVFAKRPQSVKQEASKKWWQRRAA